MSSASRKYADFVELDRSLTFPLPGNLALNRSILGSLTTPIGVILTEPLPALGADPSSGGIFALGMHTSHCTGGNGARHEEVSPSSAATAFTKSFHT